jgi:hypothetical protein
MKKFLRTFIVLVGILVITTKINMAGKNQYRHKYPIICKNELGSAPNKVSVEKVDINSDGQIDLVVTYTWGGSALFINCGHGQFYRVIKCLGKIKTEKSKTSNWKDIYINGNIGLINGKIYQTDLLPFSFKNSKQIITESICFKHNGYNYKPLFSYSKVFGVYALRYRFGSKIQMKENIDEQKVYKIYLELTPNSDYQINPEEQEWLSFGNIYFVDLNHDGALDAVLKYWDRYGVDTQVYSGLLLNSGDDSFIYSLSIELGTTSGDYQRIKSQTIKVNGIRYTAVVFEGAQFRPGLIKQTPKSTVELYIYQRKLKKFVHITALPGSDKLTFVPQDKKLFEETVVDPPLLRNK